MSPAGPPIKIDTNWFGHNELSREVYGVFGIPIDVVDMATALSKIESAAVDRAPLLISTVNLNFLVTSQLDQEFRRSLLLSDLCTADGMPVVWLARLLGLPIRERVAGSDIFEKLLSTANPARRLKVFLFGGAEGAAAAACNKLNSESSGVTCVGSFYPGFTTVAEMSDAAIIDRVNASNADFLVAALGAKKGQAWLLLNHDRIQIPARAHFGAAINFQAGTIKRSPTGMQRWGFEWLWRIKEEPQLWKRYRDDGVAFLKLLLWRAFPLMVITAWARVRLGRQGLVIERTEDQISVILGLKGVVLAHNIDQVVASFQIALAATKDVVINFSNTCVIDARFLGLLTMLHKQLAKRHLRLSITRVPGRIERIFRLSGFEFLLRH